MNKKKFNSFLNFDGFGFVLFSDYFEFELTDAFGRLRYFVRVLIGDNERLCIEIEDSIEPNLTMIRIEISDENAFLTGLYRMGLTFGDQLVIREIVDGELQRYEYLGPDYESSNESAQSSDSGEDPDTDEDVFNMNFN